MGQAWKEKLRDTLPMKEEKVLVREANLQELMEFWELTACEDRTMMNSRPVKIFTAEEARAAYEARQRDDNVMLLGLFFGDKIVGRVSLDAYNPRNKSVRMDYWTAPMYRGRGVMGSALRRLCPAALTGAGLNKIYVQTASFNAASQALMTSLGFREDGRLREHHERGGVLYDAVIYSLLASDLEEGGKK